MVEITSKGDFMSIKYADEIVKEIDDGYGKYVIFKKIQFVTISASDFTVY